MASTSTDPWVDFDSLRHQVKSNTVDRLKQIVGGLIEACGVHLTKSGKKQELIDRIQSTMDSFRRANRVDQWAHAKQVLVQVQQRGRYSPPPRHTIQTSHNLNGHNYYGAGPSTSTIVVPPPNTNIRDPYAPPQSRPIAPPRPGLEFAPSPFFAVEQAVSSIVECPESSSANDRRQQHVIFDLNLDQINKLKSSPSYQIRLYCTSSAFHPANVRNNGNPVPIEFPATCEVRVNGQAIAANLKGMKKRPGTAPPADITKYVKLGAGVRTKVEMVYVNSQTAPATPKKYYLLVNLVRVTTVDQLVDKLKRGKYRSAVDIRSGMIKSLQDDDDIVAGPQKMSLRCPLTFTRVNTPARSAQCVHPQCFDATNWLMQNEQTSHWICPVCDKILKYEDVIVDGYFDEILHQVPESVEDVMVESDGEWHSLDGKYASPRWRTMHPVKPDDTPAVKREVTPVALPPKTDITTPRDVVVLDSDDEDEGQVKRELSPSNISSSSLGRHLSNATLPPSSQISSRASMANVIDLTLSDDEDDDEPAPPPVPARVEKRKASPNADTTINNDVWQKKARTGNAARPTGPTLPPPTPSYPSYSLPRLPEPYYNNTSFSNAQGGGGGRNLNYGGNYQNGYRRP